MRLAKFVSSAAREAIGLIDGDRIVPLSTTQGQYETLTDLFEAENPAATAELLIDVSARRIPLEAVTLLPPIDRQEVWAAGVTYKRSRTARMEESVGAAVFYDQVYAAPRPELFFKAMPYRVVGHNQAIRIRQDAQWSVPEPELALVLNSRMELVGYTIGNDVSSRDIEGENPLYLPQAKVYDESCALGPCVTLPFGMPPRDEIGIRVSIQRRDAVEFEGRTTIGHMARSLEDLIGYLGRDQTFRHGVVLLTGTGIVPESGFSLLPGDVVEIEIDGIGGLRNRVVQG